MNSTMSASPAGNRWAVVLSCNAVKELRKLERDQSALEIVHKKIKDLSLGQFPLDNYRAIIGSAPHIPLFRARAANNLRIIYQIDLAPDPSGTFDHQVIKIFRIAPRARINYNFWVKVSVRLKRVNPLYKTRCEYRLPVVANDKYRPAMFPHEEYGLGISNQDSGFLLHDLSLEEREEVGHISECHGELSSDIVTLIEQIQAITMDRFVPLNKSLFNSLAADLDMALPMVLDEHERKIVGHTGASIVIGRSGTGKTTALIYKMRTIDQANATRGNYQPAKQLFVTRSRVLAQHVEATYQGLVEFTDIALKSADELKEMAKQSREDPDRALVEFDSEIDLRNDLPERFSELEDSNFPLFISFDKLCSLLEADIRHILPGQIGSETSRTLIGFEEFLHSYWPCFRGLNHLLEPNLVYSEIIGVIKGSQAAYESKEGYLTRREYVDALSRRQFPLMADIREKVYTIFELYTKHKTSRGETDAADRSRLILRHLRQTIGESRVDYLYVDEVQDNLMIDIHLLRTLAQSADNIYWSGDSAQTVVAGSAFRINDLKAFTYRDQINAGSQTHRKAPAQFTTFELNVNFRSLSGIVCFAGYVVQAIHNLFPESIDPMEPEKAKHYGDPPIVFTDTRDEAGYFENFLLGSSASNRVVFGAQQAILVRDAKTAEELDARLQGLCNVLPIMDSKGLEFDDVLIYNFFSESAAPPAAWAHLLGTARGNQAPPPVLCSELKMLYVATTRARRRCWIWDSDAISQLKAQWVSRNLVKVERASQMIGRLATTSNKAQWVSKGREYFSHRLYKLAAACFRQAGQLNDAKLSNAYHLMTRAKLRRLRGDNPSVRIDLIVAASELEECTQLREIGNRANIYYHAATCYESAHELVRASAAYTQAGRHTHGVQILFDARDLNNGAKALVNNREHLDKGFFESLREEARMHFFNRREYSQLGPLFDSAEDKIKYARDRNLKVQLKHVLEEHQYYDELAIEYMEEGDLDRGVGYYVKAYRHHRTDLSIKQAVTLAIEYAESVLLIEGVYRKTSHELAKSLIRKVRPFAVKADSESCLTVDLFSAHLCLNQVNLDMVQAWNQDNTSSRQSRNVLACYLAIKDNTWLQDNTMEVVLGYLQAWDSFIADMNKITINSNPSTSKLTQKLLGFSPNSPASKAFRVSENSLIYHRVNKSDEDDGLGVPANDINIFVRTELPKRLYGLLDSTHTAALASPWALPRRYSTSPPTVKLHQGSGKIITSTDCSTPKLQVVSKIIHVLDTSTSRGMKKFPDLTVIGQLWLERTFNILFSATGEVQSCSALSNLADSGVIAKCLRDWLQRDLNQLHSAQVSDTSITHSLLHMLTRSGMYHEFLQPSSILHVSITRNPSSSLNSNIIQPLQTLLFGRDRNRLNQAVQLLEYILDQSYRVDATTIVCLVEVLTRELVAHMNPSESADLDTIFLPFSWVMALGFKYGHTQSSADTECIDAFFYTIQRLSLELRFGPPGHLHIGGKQGSPAAIDLLNIRLCWCVALMLGNMPEAGEYLSIGVETIKRIADDDMPHKYHHRHSTSAGLYHEFADLTGRISCLETLCRTFRHESLCLVLDSPYEEHATKELNGVRLIICENSSCLVGKLERLLRGENPDSSSESDPEDHMYQDYMDQYEDMDEDIDEDQHYQEDDFPDEEEESDEYEDPYEYHNDSEEGEDDNEDVRLNSFWSARYR